MYKLGLVPLAIAVSFLRGAVSSDDCSTKATLPIGLTNQGGFAFNYQSGTGDSCRVYRLRNTPDHSVTPVLWKDDQETFMDVSLAACSPESNCPWVEAIKVSADSSMIGKTTLTYGPNKTEYKDEPDAYRKQATNRTLPPFRTILRGVLADSRGEPLRVDVELESFVEGVGPYRLTYVMSIGPESRSMRILRPGGTALGPLDLGFLWESAASDSFFQQLQKTGIEQLTSERTRVEIRFESSKIEAVESGLLQIIQGSKRIAATTAAAYRPARIARP